MPIISSSGPRAGCRIASALAAALLVALAPSRAQGEVPRAIAFQGYLTDDLGAPVDSSVTLDVALHELGSGGPVLWSETHPDVPVSGGIFSIDLGAFTPLPDSLFTRSELWLGIAVEGESEMDRTPLRTAPYAFRALDADRLDGVTPDAFVRAAGDTVPGVLALEGGVAGLPLGGVTEVVASSEDVLLRRWFFAGTGDTWDGVSARVVLVVNGVGGAAPGGSGVATVTRNEVLVATIPLSAGGSRPWAYTVIFALEDGHDVDVAVRADDPLVPVFVRSLALETIAQGETTIGVTLDEAYDEGAPGGGRTIVADAGAIRILGSGGLESESAVAIGDSAAPAVRLDPEGGGPGRPIVSIEGDERAVVLDMGVPGDGSVALPDSAISATEILDEPGLALARVPGDMPVSGAVVNMIDIVTITLTTPSSGYVRLDARAQARFSASLTGNLMAVQIDETAGGPIDAGRYFFVGYDTESPAGESYQIVSIARTYAKPAGTYTFRLEAMDQNGVGSKSLWNPSLAATFYPSAYGTITTFVPPGSGGERVVIEGNGGPSGEVEVIELGTASP